MGVRLWVYLLIEIGSHLLIEKSEVQSVFIYWLRKVQSEEQVYLLTDIGTELTMS